MTCNEQMNLERYDELRRKEVVYDMFVSNALKNSDLNLNNELELDNDKVLLSFLVCFEKEIREREVFLIEEKERLKDMLYEEPEPLPRIQTRG